jgi:hypothetical protein
VDEDAKKRIREEEIFREEVRKILSPRRSRPGKILAFLNTGVGLWLLGTVAATAVSVSYAFIQDLIRMRTDRLQRSKNLEMEGSVRLLQWGTLMVGRKAKGDETTPEEFNAYYRKLLDPPVLGNGVATGINPMFVEFERRSLVSIIYELETLQQEKKDKQELREVSGFFLEWDPLIDRKTSLEAYFRVIQHANVGVQLRDFSAQYAKAAEAAASKAAAEAAAAAARPPAPPPPPPLPPSPPARSAGTR